MRGRALFVGAAIVAVVGLWHRSPNHGSVTNDARASCEHAGAGELCAAATGLSKSLGSSLLRTSSTTILPPPETPGAIDPAIVQGNIDTTICRPGYARSKRPPYAVTEPLKRRLMEVQHPGEPLADYELDHLIPISIGGAALDRRDLWLQSRRGPANAGDKNILAYVLWRLVCEHRLSLSSAQRGISRDWTGAYKAYATPENVAKYHFRHRDEEKY